MCERESVCERQWERVCVRVREGLFDDEKTIIMRGRKYEPYNSTEIQCIAY